MSGVAIFGIVALVLVKAGALRFVNICMALWQPEKRTVYATGS